MGGRAFGATEKNRVFEVFYPLKMRFWSNTMSKFFLPPKAAAASLNDVTDWEGPQIWDIPDRALESEPFWGEGGSMSYNSTDALRALFVVVVIHAL